MANKDENGKKKMRFRERPGKCYMSVMRDLKDTTCSYEDFYQGRDEMYPLVNYDSAEAYLSDYLAMEDCPFEVRYSERSIKEIVCMVGEATSEQRGKQCKGCRLYPDGLHADGLPDNEKCRFSADFQKGYAFEVTVKQEKFNPKGTVDRGIKDMRVHDVRFRNHAAWLKISRLGYLDKRGNKYDREQLVLLPGVRAMHKGQYTIRLIKAIHEHCADGLPRGFVGEGYGVAEDTIKYCELRLSDAVSGKTLENLKKGIADGTLRMRRDFSGVPYIQICVTSVFGEPYYILYKYTPNIPGGADAGKSWRETAELVAMFPVREAEDLGEKWGTLFEKDKVVLNAVEQISGFSDADLMKILVNQMNSYEVRMPAELVFYECKMTVALAKGLNEHPENNLYQKMLASKMELGNSLKLLGQSVWTSLPKIQKYCENLSELCLATEDMELCNSVNTLKGLVEHYFSKNQNQLYADYMGESEVAWEAQREIEEYQPYREKFELKLASAFRNYRRKTGKKVKTTYPDLIRRVLYMNRAVIPTQWNSDGTSTLPFTPDGDLDTRYISTVGIRVHCLERLLNTRLLDPDRTTPLVCVTEKKSSKHPCRGCDFCPQVFPMDVLP